MLCLEKGKMTEKFVIENEDQLKITAKWKRNFELDVALLRHAPLKGTDPRFRQAEIDEIESKIKDFDEKIREYLQSIGEDGGGSIRDVNEYLSEADKEN